MAVPPPARSSGREPDPPRRPASPPEGAPEAGRPTVERAPQPHRPAAEQAPGPRRSAAEQEAGPSQSAADQAPQPPRSGDRAVDSTAGSAGAQDPAVRIWPAVQVRPTAQVRPAAQDQPAAQTQPEAQGHPAARTRPAAPTRPAVQVRPMVHVEDMAASIAFYRRLGAEIVHGGPDSDWVLVQLGATQLDLIARPPRVERGECTVELNLAVTAPLDELREMLRRSGDPDADFEVHPDLGEHLEVRTPDGLLIKISQLNPDL